MSKNIRLFYKNQFELGHAIKDYIDEYFDNKDDEIAKKPKQILGKTRLQVLDKILVEMGDSNEKNSSIK